MLALGFLSIIFLGTGLLYLPKSHHGSLSFLDAARAARAKRKFRSLTLHSKLVLSMTLILVVAGFVLILFMEWHNTLANMPISTKILASLFQSVTTRTAGFDTMNLEAMTNGTLFY